MKLNNKCAFIYLIAALLTSWNLSGCSSLELQKETEEKVIPKILEDSRVTRIREELLNPKSERVLVVAHRGDWRNAPENSIQAIKNCIDMGVDIVEIDIRKTKDNHLVVIHDKTLDRTTTGKGKIRDWTLDSLKTLYLKNGLGRSSEFHKIPTLEEAMLAAKGKIMINLDKCYNYFDEAYEVLRKTGTTDHVIIKGKKPLSRVEEDFGQYLDKVIFMPVIHLHEPEAIQSILEYQENLKPAAIEFVFNTDTLHILDRLDIVKLGGSRIWINSLWSSLNGGHDDNRAIYDLSGSYDWILGRGATIIQTDRPRMMLNYLQKKGLHE